MRKKGNSVIIFKRLSEELTLIYVFKDNPGDRIVGRVGHNILSLSLICLFHPYALHSNGAYSHL